MESVYKKNITIEKIIAFTVLFAVFVFIPYKILKSGFVPPDDVLRDVAFSLTNKNWSDVLVIEPGYEVDHNYGWHTTLRTINTYFKIDKFDLISSAVIGLFLLINITGTLVSPNSIAWSIALLIMLIFDRGILCRFMLGRPYIISLCTTLILLRLWFVESDKVSKKLKYFITFLSLVSAVWLHGTWYTFLLLSITLLLAGKIKDSIVLTFFIFISTLLGAYLTGHFKDFLFFHYANTLNIFSENIYNWQKVLELGEGNIEILWTIPTFLIIILLVYSKKLKLNDLSKDPTFILILLSWLLSIKVARFWVDWGDMALMFWLSCKLSILIEDMESIKKPLFRWVLFVVIAYSIGILIPSLKWYNKNELDVYFTDFSNEETMAFKPEDGGIIYNDSMSHFYKQFLAEPYADSKFVLGFEPAIMFSENKKVFRDLTYTNYHYTAYKPWVDKLTKKDRIFAKVDISKYYPELDWVKAASCLYIGKVKNESQSRLGVINSEL